MKEKFRPTLMANYVLWPAANLINFAFVPPSQRILYCNVVYVSGGDARAGRPGGAMRGTWQHGTHEQQEASLTWLGQLCLACGRARGCVSACSTSPTAAPVHAPGSDAVLVLKLLVPDWPAVAFPCCCCCPAACVLLLQIFWVSFLSSMANKKQDGHTLNLDPALAQKEL